MTGLIPFYPWPYILSKSKNTKLEGHLLSFPKEAAMSEYDTKYLLKYCSNQLKMASNFSRTSYFEKKKLLPAASIDYGLMQLW